MQPPERQHGVQIAVIDDDPLFAELVREALADREWEAVILHNPGTAGTAVAQVQPDAILLDLRMDGCTSGWDILTLILGNPCSAHIPVILCSAAADELGAKEAWLKSRGIMVLSKPFDIDDLYDRLDRALEISRQAELPSA